MRRFIIAAVGFLLSACTSSSYDTLATQAGVRISVVNGEITKIAQSSQLTSEDRAHYVALLEEESRKLQIQADQELVVRKALDIKDYPLFVQTVIAGADSDAAAIAGLTALRDKMQTDVEAEHQALVVHSQELAAAAKDLGQLGTPRAGADELAFLFQFAMDVNKAYSDASKSAAAAQSANKKATAQSSSILSAATTVHARDRNSLDRAGAASPSAGAQAARAPTAPAGMEKINLATAQSKIMQGVPYPVAPLY